MYQGVRCHEKERKAGDCATLADADLGLKSKLPEMETAVSKMKLSIACIRILELSNK